MLPRDYDIRNLALYAPKIAYGLVAQVSRVPFVGPITQRPGVQSPIVPIQFDTQWFGATDPAVPPPPPPPNPPGGIGVNRIIEGKLANNVTVDTLIERITFSLFQPNSFTNPQSPFQTLFLAMLKESTGVDIQIDVYGSPKYRVTDFIPLENVGDTLAVTWPNGWPLAKQNNVKVSAVLNRPAATVPYIVNMALIGWQFVDKDIDDMSDEEARRRLRAMGIDAPELAR
jgi:hypothetical protein